MAGLQTFPLILGWDISGVVEEVGFGVTTLAPGDEVYGMPWFPRAAGGYAEYVTAPARQWARKPATLDHVHATSVPLAALTAWQTVVDTAHVQAGQRILITAAAGGVGHFAVQFARHLVAHVIATASAARHPRLRELGADETIDYTTTRFEDATKDVDVVIDLVGDAHDQTSRRGADHDRSPDRRRRGRRRGGGNLPAGTGRRGPHPRRGRTHPRQGRPHRRQLTTCASSWKQRHVLRDPPLPSRPDVARSGCVTCKTVVIPFQASLDMDRTADRSPAPSAAAAPIFCPCGRGGAAAGTPKARRHVCGAGLPLERGGQGVILVVSYPDKDARAARC